MCWLVGPVVHLSDCDRRMWNTGGIRSAGELEKALPSETPFHGIAWIEHGPPR